MCGRGGIDYDWQTVWNYLNLSGEPPAGGLTRLNIAPSSLRGGEVRWTHLPVARAGDSGRRLDDMIWPLVPHWAAGELPKYSTANCRSEPGQAFSHTVAKKPAFRSAWKRQQRCLVLFSWFYEWDQRTTPKQPWRVEPAEGPLLAMAGLWDRSASAVGDPFNSFTIITSEPNALLRDIGHHRAPVILQARDFDTWLNAGPVQAEKLIVPPLDGALTATPVTRAVNNPDYEDDDLRPAPR
ncbi:MAG: SOS response-associated peptidase [Xanthomonadaceae bacterium]|nr:SOS response-associated peptidase [Xanthomonadaceae bacterium]